MAIRVISCYRISLKIIQTLITTLRKGYGLDCELIAILPIGIYISIAVPHKVLRNAINNSNSLANIILILTDIVKNIDTSKVPGLFQI